MLYLDTGTLPTDSNSMAYGRGDSMPHSQGLSNNPYPEQSQPNYLH